MVERNIMYDTSELDCSHKSNVKGFVYKIMKSTFSNMSQKTFCKKLLYCYQEFITIRKHKKFDESNKFLFHPYIFKNTYKGYIVTPRQATSSVKTLPEILRAGNSWINDCKGLNMNVTQIHSLVSQFYTKKTVVVSGHNSVHFSKMADEETNYAEEDATDIQDITVGKNFMCGFDV